MTEDEAKTKWCPAFRGNDHGINRPLEMESLIGRCLGSACMAWRWDEPWTSQTEEGNGGDIVLRLKRKPGQTRLGFCGLAGAPR